MISDATRAQLLKVRSGDYEPSSILGLYDYTYKKPIFRISYIPVMMEHPHVQLGIKMIAGRILSRSKFFIECDNPEIKQFCINQITRFWQYSASRALLALSWGFFGAEVIYRVRNSRIVFDMLKSFYPNDTRLVTRNGQKVGIKVSNVPGERGRLYIGGPKSFWHIINREYHPWYGRSVLRGAFHPWYESWKDGGGRDIRNLYFYKYAFSGDSLYYPAGQTASSDPNAPFVDNNKAVARAIVQHRRTGGVTIFPNTRDQSGNRLWEWIPAQTGPGSAPILEYNDTLKTEILEGMGVPREVVEASETGSGYSGRKVPAESFDSTLQEYTNWLIHDFDEQILYPLVRMNFSTEPDYNIVPFGLRRGSQEDSEADLDVRRDNRTVSQDRRIAQ